MSTVPARTLSMALLLFALCAGGDDACAKLGSKAWSAAKAEFGKLFAEKGQADAKIAVLKTVASDESARAYKLLAEALQRELAFTQAIRVEYAKAAMLHGDLLLASYGGYTSTGQKSAQELQVQMKTLEADGRAERQVFEALNAILCEGSAKARKGVIRLAKPKADVELRVAVARIAGRTAADKTSVAHLKKALADPDRRVRLAALDGMAGSKKLAATAHKLLLLRLEDPDPGIVHAAAAVVRAHPTAAAAAPLQKAWGGASRRVGRGLQAALEALLADKGPAATDGDLQAWWAKQDKSPTRAKVGTIPLESDGVLFVIDLSNAMKSPTEVGSWKRADAPAGAKLPPEPEIEGSLFDRAKHEMQVAIKRLPKGTYFNILAYNHGATAWSRSMRLATEEAKDSTRKWLRALKPRGSGYVAGALRLAFRMAQALAVGAEVEAPLIDTIVVLSIGAPTDNSFPTHRKMEPEGILARVRLWNASAGLKIHAVCLGQSDFMRDLAAQNGGTYVHR